MKKIVCFILLSLLVCSASVISFGASTELRVNKIPVFEGGMTTQNGLLKAASNPKVTASDIDYYWVYGYFNPGDAVEATGYVTVKDGTKDYYHYTKTNIQNLAGSEVYYSSGQKWGYGKVTATTGPQLPPDPYDNEARVFYGW